MPVPASPCQHNTSTQRVHGSRSHLSKKERPARQGSQCNPTFHNIARPTMTCTFRMCSVMKQHIILCTRRAWISRSIHTKDNHSHRARQQRPVLVLETFGGAFSVGGEGDELVIRRYRPAALCAQEAQRKGTAQRNSKPPQQTIGRRRGETRCDREGVRMEEHSGRMMLCLPTEEIATLTSSPLISTGLQKHDWEPSTARDREVQRHPDSQRLG